MKSTYRKLMVIAIAVILVFGGYYFLYVYHQNPHKSTSQNNTQMDHREKVLYYCNFTIFKNFYLKIYSGKGPVNNTTFCMPYLTKGFAYCIYSNDTSECIEMGAMNQPVMSASCVPYGLNKISSGTTIVSATGIFYLLYFNAIKSGNIHIILYSSKTFDGKLYFDN